MFYWDFFSVTHDGQILSKYPSPLITQPINLKCATELSTTSFPPSGRAIRSLCDTAATGVGVLGGTRNNLFSIPAGADYFAAYDLEYRVVRQTISQLKQVHLLIDVEGI